MGLIDSGSKSNRLLASRRFTSTDIKTSQEAFQSVLDIQASEIFTQGDKIPSGSLPYSGSTQQRAYYTDGGDNILLYYYRHRLTPSNVDSDVWFFMDPTGSATGVTPQLIQDEQQTAFVSPKYSVSSLANSTTEDAPPGYGVKVFSSTSEDSGSLGDGDVVSANDYQFDYKTGVLQFDASKPGSSNIVYMTAYQYVGTTLDTGINVTGDVSSSFTSTGSFGRLEIAGNSNLVGNLTIGGNITIGDADTDSIAITADLSSSLIPNADITYDLGSPSRRYQFGYLESMSTTNVTASGDLSVESTGSIGKLVAGDITEEIFVTVINTSEGNRYAFEGEITPDFTIDEGKSYRFDQSDASNGGHPLKFSLTENGIHPGGTEYTAGVVSSSVAQGSAGSYIELRVDKNTSNYLYYYCINHGNMGADARLLKNDLTNLHFVSGSSVSTGSFGKLIGDGSEITNLTEEDPNAIAFALALGG